MEIMYGMLAVAAFLLFLAFRSPKKVVGPVTNWAYYFEELRMPAQEFFDRIEENVSQTEIPDIEFSKVTYRQEGFFSASREYLRISRNEYLIDICAAPFGKGFFVSYWLGLSDGGIIAKIPVINRLSGKDVNSKTYYQLDTEMMFRKSMHACIVRVIDEISNSKGIRGITELQRQPVNFATTTSN